MWWGLWHAFRDNEHPPERFGRKLNGTKVGTSPKSNSGSCNARDVWDLLYNVDNMSLDEFLHVDGATRLDDILKQVLLIGQSFGKVSDSINPIYKFAPLFLYSNIFITGNQSVHWWLGSEAIRHVNWYEVYSYKTTHEKFLNRGPLTKYWV